MKTLLAIAAIILVLVLVFFRFQSESGPMALARCKTAVAQAKSWTVESTSEPNNANNTTFKNRIEVSCPDSYKSVFKSRTPDNIIREQATVYASGLTYVENMDGNWTKGSTVGESPALKECGKGPLLVQQTVFNAIIELPRRRAGKMEKGELQSIDGVSCQEWSVDYGNEWPQMAPYTICIDRKTHLPRRITYSESGATNDFSGWNSTTAEPPTL
ncbi:MAG TPA: hypothetical protein VJO16_09255 [Candidatus Acidoferrum sp.]|nr:hypothetical protein [Candidatus Acidoferrum sp.]